MSKSTAMTDWETSADYAWDNFSPNERAQVDQQSAIVRDKLIELGLDPETEDWWKGFLLAIGYIELAVQGAGLHPAIEGWLVDVGKAYAMLGYKTHKGAR